MTFSGIDAALKPILDTLPQLIAFVDTDLVYRYANRSYQTWFNTGDVIGKKIKDVIGPSAFETVAPYLDRALRGEKTEFEVEVTYPNEMVRQIRANYLPQVDGQGKVVGLSIVVSDISLQREIEQRLIESEQRLRFALEATGEGVWDWYVNSDLVSHNKQWTVLLGLTDSFLEHPLREFSERIHEDDREAVFHRLKETLAGHTNYMSEHRMRRNDGSYMWVLDRGKVVEWDDDGKPRRMVGSFKDITELRAIQESLLQASQLATLGEMAAGVAHEINNPLAIIMGNLALFESSPPAPEKALEIYKKMSRATHRIAKIVAGLKRFSRNSDESQRLPFPVRDLINQAIELCKERAFQERVHLEVDLNSERKILCDETEIEQVVINLINNAMDAIGESAQKSVKVRLVDAGDKVVISVTDSGPGVPDQMRAQIFKPFFTTKKLGKGTGLGLSICKGIVEGHGGAIALLERFPPTCFEVSLPALGAS